MSMFAVVDPATGTRVAEYPETDAAGLEDALRRVAAAYTGWARGAAVEERARLLRLAAPLRPRRGRRGARPARPRGRPAAPGAPRRARRDHRARDGQARQPSAGRGRVRR